MKKNSVYDCTVVELDKHHSDRKGNISVVENQVTIPFNVKRIYYLYDVPGGEARGGHVFKKNEEFIVALSGAFDVIVDDGHKKKTFTLNRSYYGLYVPAGLWREMENFSTNSLALEFGSIHYDVNDYIRDYDEFLKLKRHGEI